MKIFKAMRYYKKSTKKMFQSENKNEVISFMQNWKLKNGVRLHLLEIEVKLK